MEASPSRSPDRNAIQSLAGSVMRTKVVNVLPLEGHLQRIYQLNSESGKSFCLMKCTPPPEIRLLGLEEDKLAVEASVLALLGRRVDIAAPKLLEYQASTSVFGDSYLINGPYSGSIMSFMAKTWSESDRIDIDRSLGTYFKKLATITNEQFGPYRRPVMSSWAQCFASLLEVLLINAEEEGITLPYAKLRDMVAKFWSSLDRVTESKLMLLEVRTSRDLVVDENTREVTSLVDYSTAMWGDPFLSDVFQRPSRSFLDGYGADPNGDIDRRIRKPLYTIFHSLYALVRERYRPQSANIESEAMTSLLTALRYLDNMMV